MDDGKHDSNYDAFARVYNRHWGPSYGRNALPILQTLLGNRLRPGSSVLDLCCGSGHVSQSLIQAGYKVIGIDISKELLSFARDNAPSAVFHHADARNFSLDTECELVICLNDSLNHMLRADELRKVFECVFQVLQPEGWFLFDLNLSQSWYPPEEVLALLSRVGFAKIEPMTRDGNTIESPDVDKAYFRCMKPDNW